jgi:hypothetical protein
MTALIPILAVLLLVVLKNPLRPPAATAGTDATPGVTAPPVSEDVEIDWQIPPEYSPDSHDPMRWPSASRPNPATNAVPADAHIVLLVTGILYSADKPAAVVDTQVVHEGQQVSGATVVNIEKDRVEFEMNGQRWQQTVSK